MWVLWGASAWQGGAIPAVEECKECCACVGGCLGVCVGVRCIMSLRSVVRCMALGVGVRCVMSLGVRCVMLLESVMRCIMPLGVGVRCVMLLESVMTRQSCIIGLLSLCRCVCVCVCVCVFDPVHKHSRLCFSEPSVHVLCSTVSSALADAMLIASRVGRDGQA